MGLIAAVYKQAGRTFSCGGISERCDEVTVMNAKGPHEPRDTRPAVIVVHRGQYGPIVVPAELVGGDWEPMVVPDRIGPMAGGCYVATTGGAFRDLVGFYGAVALHDRYETQELYDAMWL